MISYSFLLLVDGTSATLEPTGKVSSFARGCDRGTW